MRYWNIGRPTTCARENDRVECAPQHGGLVRYLGVVTRDGGDDTYDVRFDDGAVEAGVAVERLTVLREADEAQLAWGARVEVKYHGADTWYPGTIETDNGDQTYNIAYDDGDKEARVTPDFIRLTGCAPFAEASHKYSTGDDVWFLMLHGVSGKWHQGTVTSCRWVECLSSNHLAPI